MPTYRQDIKATTGNSPVNQVAGAAQAAAGAASSFDPNQSMAGYILENNTGGGASGMIDSMRSYKQQQRQASQISAGNGKGVGVLSGAAAMRSSQAAGAVPGSGGDISELSDRVSALEGGQATSQPGDGPLNGNKVMGVFPNSAQNAAQGVFGSQDQRQQSVGSAPLLQYKDPSIGFIKQRPKEFKTPVYQPDDRPKTKKLQKPNKYTKLVEKKVELKEVINKRL